MDKAPKLPWVVRHRDPIWAAVFIVILIAADLPVSGSLALGLLYTFMWVTERWSSHHQQELIVWHQRVTWAQQFGCKASDILEPEAFKAQFEAWAAREREARHGS